MDGEFFKLFAPVFLGSFLGGIATWLIAMWQINKTQKLNNIQFYIQFNKAQIYINRFNEKVDNIMELTQGPKRGSARILLNGNDYLELKNDLELAIKTVNKDLTKVDFKEFVFELGEYNQYAPLAFYRDLSYVFFEMALVYNMLLEDSQYVVDDLPERIEIPRSPFGQQLSLSFILKSFRRTYKKMERKLKF
ncbi:hypothetical protein [Mesobacillus selenatarsenatis]|uniref:hypothetical protein n=1 Tax=Mesobacillus selenatarsenatis TaxID=388741 RepID=UPI00143553ED|nr:hypothetical protein [Mesobacillus selenatarsenatis]